MTCKRLLKRNIRFTFAVKYTQYLLAMQRLRKLIKQEVIFALLDFFLSTQVDSILCFKVLKNLFLTD
jgi:hypothetical protein